MNQRLMIAVAGFFLAGTVNAGALDAKRFQIKLTPDDAASHEKNRKEEIVFEDDMLQSMGYAKNGFKPGKYEVGDAGRFTQWNAVQKSESAGTLTWTGVLRGNKIEGSLVVSPLSGGSTRYLFRGKRIIDKS